jgi:circadian clock protein KaiB
LGSVFLDQYLLEVVDVLENPELAESEKILATPTVVRSEPAPSGKYLIDLENTDKLLKRLEFMKNEGGNGPTR